MILVEGEDMNPDYQTDDNSGQVNDTPTPMVDPLPQPIAADPITNADPVISADPVVSPDPAMGTDPVAPVFSSQDYGQTPVEESPTFEAETITPEPVAEPSLAPLQDIEAPSQAFTGEPSVEASFSPVVESPDPVVAETTPPVDLSAESPVLTANPVPQPDLVQPVAPVDPVPPVVPAPVAPKSKTKIFIWVGVGILVVVAGVIAYLFLK